MPSNPEPRIWLYEYIGRSLWTSISLLCAWATGGMVRYADVHPVASAKWRRLFSDSRFDQIASEFTVSTGTHLQIYRLIEKRATEIEEGGLFKSFQRFLPHPKIGPVIRKALIIDGFTALMLSQETEKCLAEGHAVYFLPRAARPYLTEQFKFASRAIPWPWQFILVMAVVRQRLLQPIYFAVGCAWLLVKNGVVWRLPQPKQWAVAQMVRGKLSANGLLNDALIYQGGVLAPQNILHVLQEPAGAGYWEYACNKGLPVVDPQTLRSTTGFIWRRLICGYVPLALRAWWASVVSGTAVDVVRAILSIGLYVLEVERLALHHRSRVFFGWDTYWVRADVRAMVWGRLGGCYVGYIHAAPWLPLYFYQNSAMPVLLCSGMSVRDMFGETLQHVGQVVPVGLMNTELTLAPGPDAEALRSAARGRHIVAVFDSTFGPLYGQTCDIYEIFYQGLLDVVSTYPEVVLYIKRKYLNEVNPVYDRFALRLTSHPRIRILGDMSAYDLLAAADSVIAIATSTVGWEGLACRKPTFFFDPRKEYQQHVAWKYGPPLLCHTIEELVERFGHVLKGRYLDETTWTRIVKYETCFADERPLTAVRNILLDKAGIAPGGNISKP